MLAILLILALVPPTIFPGVHTVSVHVVVDPLTLVLAPVHPLVGATAVDFVLEPVTRVL